MFEEEIGNERMKQEVVHFKEIITHQETENATLRHGLYKRDMARKKDENEQYSRRNTSNIRISGLEDPEEKESTETTQQMSWNLSIIIRVKRVRYYYEKYQEWMDLSWPEK